MKRETACCLVFGMLLVAQISGTCQKLTICDDGEEELIPPTATSDRYCGSSGFTETELSAFLDEKQRFKLHWNVSHAEQIIHIVIEVETHGWIGLGMSPTGGMTGADMIVAWVTPEGNIHFTDRHSTDFVKPVVDDSQDCELLSAYQNVTHTVVEFRRPFYTCDDDDMDIGDGTSKVIWAFGDGQDPQSEEEFFYHGSSNRGTKNINLLTATPQNHPDDLASAQHVDLLVGNAQLSNKRTEYYCKAFELPTTSSKQHIISWEAIVEPKNLGRVHHVLAYQCDDLSASELSYEGLCNGNMPGNLQSCRGGSPIATWAVGQDPVILPDHVGIPMGQVYGQARYVLTETHYDNPDLQAFTDNSGIRLRYTDQLREHDAGIMQVGHGVSDWMVIPPGADDFKIYSACPSQCTSGLPQDLVIFGVFLHEHLAGIGMKVQHIRNGKELEPLGNNPTYDFNYQTLEMYPQPRIVKPGDDILVECRYRTTQAHVDYLASLGYDESPHAQSKTVGGEGTYDEMCLAYFLYYPKIPVDRCWPVRYPVGDDYDFIKKSGTWTQAEIDEWQKRVGLDEAVFSSCPDYPLFAASKIDEPLPAVDTGCNVTSPSPSPSTPRCQDDDDMAVQLCPADAIAPCTCDKLKVWCYLEGWTGDVIRQSCKQTCQQCEGMTLRETCVDDNGAMEKFAQLLFGISADCQQAIAAVSCSEPNVAAACPLSCNACSSLRRRKSERRDVEVPQCGSDEYFDMSLTSTTTTIATTTPKASTASTTTTTHLSSGPSSSSSSTTTESSQSTADPQGSTGSNTMSYTNATIAGVFIGTFVLGLVLAALFLVFVPQNPVTNIVQAQETESGKHLYDEMAMENPTFDQWAVSQDLPN